MTPCKKRGRGGGIEKGGEDKGDSKLTTGKTKGNTGSVGTEITEKKRGLKEEQVMDRKTWKRLINVHK